jgi:hypothetical protein
MTTRLFFLEDQREHAANSDDFKELCRLELQPDEEDYLVIAKGDLKNHATEVPPGGFADHGSFFVQVGGGGSFEFRLEIFNRFSNLIVRDETRISTPPGTVGQGPSTFALMAQAHLPSGPVDPAVPPHGHAVLSVRGRGALGIITGVRIFALHADEIVATIIT